MESKLDLDISSLPPEAQKQIQDFVANVKARYTSASKLKTRRGLLTDEPFIGMWRGRDDLQDSTAWVREVRRQEWGNHQ
jgi:hypothetical protein